MKETKPRKSLKKLGRTSIFDHCYQTYIHRGPMFMVDGKAHQRRVGAVVGIVTNKKLSIGWSLCNSKEGDRFNPEVGISIATGRASAPHENSISIKVKAGVSTQELIQKGVPQSSLSAMSEVIQLAMKNHHDLETIVIFNDKRVRAKTPKLLWEVSTS